MANPEQFAATGYLTGPDGTELFLRFWEPESFQAGVLAFHGLGGHGEWYESLAISLLPRGVALLAPDLRGHGMTRWDLGRLPREQLLLRDARMLRDEFARRNPGRPLFLMGTGLGACLALLLAAEGASIDGVILLSPSFKATYLGWREKGRMLLALLFGRQNGALTPLGRGLPLCGDRLRLQWLARDPLALTWLPARTYWNARQLIGDSRRSLARVQVPLLCVQGGEDPVTDPEASRTAVGTQAGRRFVLWERGAHELALEADSDYLAGMIGDWIRHQGARLAAGG
jgi:alpha-beta hydrolase superfamily lysophospholipase